MCKAVLKLHTSTKKIAKGNRIESRSMVKAPHRDEYSIKKKAQKWFREGLLQVNA